MTKREWLRRDRQTDVLLNLGFTVDQAESLRRISLTLHRWHELECGIDNGCIERDETTNKPMWHNAMSGRLTPIADRETGAIRRLDTILKTRNATADAYGDPALSYYLQTDPRGCALYILRPGDVPDGADVASYYSRGIAIY